MDNEIMNNNEEIVTDVQTNDEECSWGPLLTLVGLTGAATLVGEHVVIPAIGRGARAVRSFIGGLFKKDKATPKKKDDEEVEEDS